MNEQKINVCRALASVFTNQDEVTDKEAAFVGRAALDLGLDEGELKLVQQALATPLELKPLLASITDVDLRHFLFRRIVAATLIDEHLNENDKDALASTAESFGWDQSVVQEYVAHMKQGLEWEKKGEDIISRLH
jgi:hypothetical protein